jgi:hypothetical protein
MQKVLRAGGFIAGLVLVVFGVVAIWMGVSGQSTVSDNLKQQQIVGTPDMTPTAITAAAKTAGLDIAKTPIPSCSVANVTVTDGSTARCFAQYMQVHALEATGGMLYSQMPRYASADGKGTNDAATALKTANGQPQANPARNIWIQETALTTALNTSYMADQLSLFGIVVGVALLLSGVGFLVLAAGLIPPLAMAKASTPAPVTTPLTAEPAATVETNGKVHA